MPTHDTETLAEMLTEHRRTVYTLGITGCCLHLIHERDKADR